MFKSEKYKSFVAISRTNRSFCGFKSGICVVWRFFSLKSMLLLFNRNSIAPWPLPVGRLIDLGSSSLIKSIEGVMIATERLVDRGENNGDEWDDESSFEIFEFRRRFDEIEMFYNDKIVTSQKNENERTFWDKYCLSICLKVDDGWAEISRDPIEIRGEFNDSIWSGWWRLWTYWAFSAAARINSKLLQSPRCFFR